MKRTPLDWGLLYAKTLTDFALVMLAFLLAYGIKFKVGLLGRAFFNTEFGMIYPQAQIEPYIRVVGLVGAVSLVTFYMSGVYGLFRGALANLTESVKVVRGMSLTVLWLMAFGFIYKPFPGSRYVMFYFWLIGIGLLVLSRWFYGRLYLWLHRHGKGNLTALILGDTVLATELGSRIVNMPHLGYRLLGFMSDQPMASVPYTLRHHYRHVGPPAQLAEFLNAHRVDVVVLSDVQMPSENLMALCRQYGARLMVAADINYFYFSLDRLDDIPVLTLKDYPLDESRHRWVKRGLDLVLLLVLFPVILPLIGLLYMVLLWVEGKPVLYAQERLGKDEKPFHLLKFRTMTRDAENVTGPVYVAENDTRITRLGLWLRKTSLDELPQFFNVLQGDMSLVGPRPEREHFYKLFESDLPMFRQRLRVQPGITGWAQIHGRSGLTRRTDEKLLYDLYYINQWSWLLDVKILLKTIGVVLSQQEAY